MHCNIAIYDTTNTVGGVVSASRLGPTKATIGSAAGDDFQLQLPGGLTDLIPPAWFSIQFNDGTAAVTLVNDSPLPVTIDDSPFDPANPYVVHDQASIKFDVYVLKIELCQDTSVRLDFDAAFLELHDAVYNTIVAQHGDWTDPSSRPMSSTEEFEAAVIGATDTARPFSADDRHFWVHVREADLVLAVLDHLLQDPKFEHQRFKPVMDNPRLEGQRRDLVRSVADHVVQTLPLFEQASEVDMAACARAALRSHTSFMSDDFTQYIGLRHVKTTVFDRVFAYGPLTRLLRQRGVTDILINGMTSWYVERNGFLQKVIGQFSSAQESRGLVERLLKDNNAHVDWSNPAADGQFEDGARFNIVGEPVATATVMSLRLHRQQDLTADDLVAQGSIIRPVLELLAASVAIGKSILVVGGVGSGKTTFLNIMADSIPEDQRVITIEDTRELQLKHEHTVSLEAKWSGDDRDYSLDDGIISALRMRPDWIIVGEVRGAEALQMLRGVSTGHAAMTTCHAPDARRSVERLASMATMAGIPVHEARRTIASAFDLIVVVERHRGRRLLTEVVELLHIDDDTGEPRLRPIAGRVGSGELTMTGYLPTYFNDLVRETEFSLSNHD